MAVSQVSTYSRPKKASPLPVILRETLGGTPSLLKKGNLHVFPQPDAEKQEDGTENIHDDPSFRKFKTFTAYE